MKTLSLVLSAGLLVVAVAVVALGRTPAQAQVPTSGVGGQLSIGATSIVSGKLVVPLDTTAATDQYSGFSIHVRWSAPLLSYASVDTSGGTLAAGAPLCLAASDGDGLGVVVGCSSTALPAGQTAAAGTLAKVSLNQLATGCAQLHIFTLNGPDGGDSTFGSYTINADDTSPQLNTYGPDAFAGVSGGVCLTPTATSTATKTPTLTPTATNSPTPTNTPTPTFTPVLGAPDVAAGIFPLPTVVDSGGAVSLSAFIANLGTSAATDVQLHVTLPPGAVLTTPGSCPFYVAGNVVCHLGTLAMNNGVPGGPDEASVTLSVRMPYTLGNLSAVTFSLATASNEPLANQGNNAASAVVFVGGCPDINGDGFINGLDLNVLSLAFFTTIGHPAYNPLADLNSDGAVNALDLNTLAVRFGDVCVGLDSDHDGISDHDEINVYSTCPGLAVQFQSLSQCHVDGDTLNPLIADSTDTEGDGLPDGVEVVTYASNPLIDDTDGDFYGDEQEAGIGKNPAIYCGVMAADMFTDGSVNALDLNMLASAFFQSYPAPGFVPRTDINRDNMTNALDLNQLAHYYLHVISECP